MTTLHRIALLGFSAFERTTMSSYLRLAATRNPRYEQVQMLPEADFVVADADHEPSVKLVMAVERLPETVFVGSAAPTGAVAWMTRPIDPLRVLRELDALATRRQSQPAPARGRLETQAEEARRRTVIQPVRPPRPDPPADLLAAAADGCVDLPLPDLPAAPAAAQPSSLPLLPVAAQRPRPISISAVAAARADAVPPMRAAASVPAQAAQAARPAAARAGGAAARPTLPSTALLVDDSEVALRFLQRKLAPFGLVTDCVAHSDAAVRRLAERRYDFVFLDMELGEASALDGLSLCQRIKRDAAQANVVMVTAHHTELDRVRGALAGCDGFLGKPLDEEELALYLARFGVRPAANAGCVPS